MSALRHARPRGASDRVGMALLRCATVAEAHVVGAMLVLRAEGVRVTADTLAWAISRERGDRTVHRSYVMRGLADGVANRTVRRLAWGVYEPGPRIADLVDEAGREGAS